MVAILAHGDANGEDFIQSGRCVCKRVGARCHRFSFKFWVEVCHRRTLCDKSTSMNTSKHMGKDISKYMSTTTIKNVC